MAWLKQSFYGEEMIPMELGGYMNNAFSFVSHER